MNLTKIFFIEIACGILLLIFFTICLFIPASQLTMIALYIANFLLLLPPFIYNDRKLPIKYKEEELVLKISWIIPSIILFIIIILFFTIGKNLKTFSCLLYTSPSPRDS